MKKNKKYLELYYKWIKQGHIDPSTYNFNGLCDLFKKDRLFKLFIPTLKEKEEYNCTAYWGCDLTERDYIYSSDRSIFYSGFTETRQNIVLFMAAMNGEL